MGWNHDELGETLMPKSALESSSPQESDPSDPPTKVATGHGFFPLVPDHVIAIVRIDARKCLSKEIAKLLLHCEHWTWRPLTAVYVRSWVDRFPPSVPLPPDGTSHRMSA